MITIPLGFAAVMIGKKYGQKLGELADKTFLRDFNGTLTYNAKMRNRYGSEDEFAAALERNEESRNQVNQLALSIAGQVETLVRRESMLLLRRYFNGILEDTLNPLNINVQGMDRHANFGFTDAAAFNAEIQSADDEARREDLEDGLTEEGIELIHNLRQVPHEIAKTMGPMVKSAITSSSSKQIMNQAFRNSPVLGRVINHIMENNQDETSPEPSSPELTADHFIYKKGLASILSEADEEPTGYRNRGKKKRKLEIKSAEELYAEFKSAVKDSLREDGLTSFSRGIAQLRSKLEDASAGRPNRRVIKKSVAHQIIAAELGIPSGAFARSLLGESSSKSNLPLLRNKNISSSSHRKRLVEEKVRARQNDILVGKITDYLLEDAGFNQFNSSIKSNRKSKKRRKTKNYLREKAFYGSLVKALLMEKEGEKFDSLKATMGPQPTYTGKTDDIQGIFVKALKGQTPSGDFSYSPSGYRVIIRVGKDKAYIMDCSNDGSGVELAGDNKGFLLKGEETISSYLKGYKDIATNGASEANAKFAREVLDSATSDYKNYGAEGMGGIRGFVPEKDQYLSDKFGSTDIGKKSKERIDSGEAKEEIETVKASQEKAIADQAVDKAVNQDAGGFVGPPAPLPQGADVHPQHKFYLKLKADSEEASKKCDELRTKINDAEAELKTGAGTTEQQDALKAAINKTKATLKQSEAVLADANKQLGEVKEAITRDWNNPEVKEAIIFIEKNKVGLAKLKKNISDLETQLKATKDPSTKASIEQQIKSNKAALETYEESIAKKQAIVDDNDGPPKSKRGSSDAGKEEASNQDDSSDENQDDSSDENQDDSSGENQDDSSDDTPTKEEQFSLDQEDKLLTQAQNKHDAIADKMNASLPKGYRCVVDHDTIEITDGEIDSEKIKYFIIRDSDIQLPDGVKSISDGANAANMSESEYINSLIGTDPGEPDSLKALSTQIDDNGEEFVSPFYELNKEGSSTPSAAYSKIKLAIKDKGGLDYKDSDNTAEDYDPEFDSFRKARDEMFDVKEKGEVDNLNTAFGDDSSSDDVNELLGNLPTTDGEIIEYDASTNEFIINSKMGGQHRIPRDTLEKLAGEGEGEDTLLYKLNKYTSQEQGAYADYKSLIRANEEIQNKYLETVGKEEAPIQFKIVKDKDGTFKLVDNKGKTVSYDFDDSSEGEEAVSGVDLEKAKEIGNSLAEVQVDSGDDHVFQDESDGGAEDGAEDGANAGGGSGSPSSEVDIGSFRPTGKNIDIPQEIKFDPSSGKIAMKYISNNGQIRYQILDPDSKEALSIKASRLSLSDAGKYKEFPDQKIWEFEFKTSSGIIKVPMRELNPNTGGYENLDPKTVTTPTLTIKNGKIVLVNKNGEVLGPSSSKLDQWYTDNNGKLKSLLKKDYTLVNQSRYDEFDDVQGSQTIIVNNQAEMFERQMDFSILKRINEKQYSIYNGKIIDNEALKKAGIEFKNGLVTGDLSQENLSGLMQNGHVHVLSSNGRRILDVTVKDGKVIYPRGGATVEDIKSLAQSDMPAGFKLSSSVPDKMTSTYSAPMTKEKIKLNKDKLAPDADASDAGASDASDAGASDAGDAGASDAGASDAGAGDNTQSSNTAQVLNQANQNASNLNTAINQPEPNIPDVQEKVRGIWDKMSDDWKQSEMGQKLKRFLDSPSDSEEASNIFNDIHNNDGTGALDRFANQIQDKSGSAWDAISKHAAKQVESFTGTELSNALEDADTFEQAADILRGLGFNEKTIEKIEEMEGLDDGYYDTDQEQFEAVQQAVSDELNSQWNAVQNALKDPLEDVEKAQRDFDASGTDANESTLEKAKEALAQAKAELAPNLKAVAGIEDEGQLKVAIDALSRKAYSLSEGDGIAGWLPDFNYSGLIPFIPVPLWGYRAYKGASAAVKGNYMLDGDRGILHYLTATQNEFLLDSVSTPIAYKITEFLQNYPGLKALGLKITGKLKREKIDDGLVEEGASGDVSALFSKSAHSEAKEFVKLSRKLPWRKDKPATEAETLKMMEKIFKENVEDICVGLILKYDNERKEEAKKDVAANIATFEAGSEKRRGMASKSGIASGGLVAGGLTYLVMGTAATATIASGGWLAPLLGVAAGAGIGGVSGKFGFEALSDRRDIKNKRKGAGRNLRKNLKEDENVKKDVMKIMAVVKSIAKDIKNIQDSYDRLHKNKLTKLLFERNLLLEAKMTGEKIKRKLQRSGACIYGFMDQSTSEFKKAESDFVSSIGIMLEDYFGIAVDGIDPNAIQNIKSTAAVGSNVDQEAPPGKPNNVSAMQNLQGIPMPHNMQGPVQHPAQFAYGMAHAGGNNMSELIKFMTSRQERFEKMMIEMMDKNMNFSQAAQTLSNEKGTNFTDLEKSLEVGLGEINSNKETLSKETINRIYYTIKKSNIEDSINSLENVTKYSFKKEIFEIEQAFVGQIRMMFNYVDNKVTYNNKTAIELSKFIMSSLKEKEVNDNKVYNIAHVNRILSQQLLDIDLKLGNKTKVSEEELNKIKVAIGKIKVLKESFRKRPVKRVVKRKNTLLEGEYYNRSLSTLLFEVESISKRKPVKKSSNTKEDRETDLQKEWRRIWNIK